MTCLYVHAKTMQKPCKMRRVRPPNIHSPRVPCYMCYMCYISQGKPLNIHSPRVPCYMCYMCYISQGKPLNIHSPGFLAICAICAIWYRSLYTIHIASQHVPNMPCIAHILHFEARTEYIAHIVHIARTRTRVLEMQPGAKLQAYLGVSILQPHASTQRFRLRILCRTRSNAGRTSARSLSGRI